MPTFVIDYGTGKERRITVTSREQAEAFAASERAILRNPDVRVKPTPKPPRITAAWQMMGSRRLRRAQVGDLILWVQVKKSHWDHRARWAVEKNGLVYLHGEVLANDRVWRYASYEREAMLRAEEAAATVPEGAS
jgi:hypothetical protein